MMKDEGLGGAVKAGPMSPVLLHLAWMGSFPGFYFI